MQKRPPKSSKNEMLIFGLHSISDDWLSDLSDKTGPKCKYRFPKLSSGSFLCYLLLVFCVIFWQSSGSLLCYLLAVFCVIFFIIIINLVTLTLCGDNNNKGDNTEDCQKIIQKTARIPPEDSQKTTRRPPNDHQKTARKPPEYYYLSDSDLVRWCCCHVLSGVIPAPRTHMVGCFVLLLLMHFKCKYSRNHYFKDFMT